MKITVFKFEKKTERLGILTIRISLLCSAPEIQVISLQTDPYYIELHYHIEFIT